LIVPLAEVEGSRLLPLEAVGRGAAPSFALVPSLPSPAAMGRKPKRQRPECPSPFQQQQQQQQQEGALLVAATAIDWLTLLSQELLICVLKYLEDYSDCARFSLASPRLGLIALQNGLQLPRFQHPLFAVAMRLIMRQAGGREGMRSSTLARRAEARARSMTTPGSARSRFAEAWLRKYAAGYAAASPDDFEWIKATSPELHIVQSTLLSSQQWHLVRGGVPDAKVRTECANGVVLYYEGEKGAEHYVRAESITGTVEYYEGEKGAERGIRAELANGAVQYYEGEQGAERLVRTDSITGVVQYFEGENGAERRVRAEDADGTVKYFEGEKGAERRVRAEHLNGFVYYYEGEKGAERRVRAEHANGFVYYYEGEKGAERAVRVEFADGFVDYYEGEKGAERAVRVEFADGFVDFYEGEKGAERLVRAEFADGTVDFYEGEKGAERLTH
jgi:hypothetical protein